MFSFRCILFHFYIKPQHLAYHILEHTGCILFHFYIKPQHSLSLLCSKKVVSYSISTSNHNLIVLYFLPLPVVSYSISTSNHNIAKCLLQIGLVVSYSISTSNHNCANLPSLEGPVVSYSISTSNHNAMCLEQNHRQLYLIPFLHQTTTINCLLTVACGCILFHFYIKPQPMAHKTLFSSTLSPKSHSHFQRNAVV